MNANVKLGKIFGIPIGLHYSWFLIFALITFSLGTGYFAQQYPQLTGNINLVLALVTSLLFFSSVVLHELGHSVIALRNRIPVKGITLFIFGGVAQIAREPETPGAEFRIAIAGPLVSFATGRVVWRRVPVRAANSDIGSAQPVFDGDKLYPGAVQSGARLPARRWAGAALDRLETDRQLRTLDPLRINQRAAGRFWLYRFRHCQPFQGTGRKRSVAGIHRLVLAGRGCLSCFSGQFPGEAARPHRWTGHVS